VLIFLTLFLFLLNVERSMLRQRHHRDADLEYICVQKVCSVKFRAAEVND